MIEIVEKILITCALPYVNNVPHIGNIAGSHLPADIFARLCRLAGYDTVFIGGSDEHGTPAEVTAERLGITPRELSDFYFKIHKDIYDWLDISYDNFSRTSIPLHHETTLDFFEHIQKNGFIVENTVRLPYCENCRRVLPDRYVEGVCPKCEYEHARGDQCERCSTLLNPEELKSPRCAICGEEPVIRDSNHLFLSLDKLEPRLREWIESKKGEWTGQVVNMALGWLNEGLKPRSITRDIKWGVKVPLKGYEDKVFYVWFDAPIGYVSSTKEWALNQGEPELWREYWQGDARIYHFVGKDNIPFHTIFWPGILIARGGYSLPYRVAGLQYLNYEGDKISKSKGFGVFCENLPDAGLSSDIWRYYLTLLIPETNDSEWKWAEFQERVNNELVANLGNFIHRSLHFIQSKFDGVVPEPDLSEDDIELLKSTEEFAAQIQELIFDIRFREALRKVFELSDRGNKYFQSNEPWKLIKTDPKKAGTVLYVCANLCYDLAVLLSPFMPKSSAKIFEILNTKPGTLQDVGRQKVAAGTKINRPEPLFPKLDDKKISELKNRTSQVTKYEEMIMGKISYDEFSRLDIRVAEIVEVEPVKGADKLLKLTIDVGGKTKQIVGGIAQQYSKDELVGKRIVVLDNLEPAVIRGVKSEGMLLAAVDGDEISILTPDRDAKPGSKIM
ncbi:MAG TPA: methionine--tRNA ligase [Euryarchaeota archaeon]|nr:methionine--tRNA ligase [Euryarchaeota archaeon]